MSRSLNDLDPVFRARVVEWLDDCKIAGINVLITCTRRTNEEQDGLYAIGRTVPGDGISEARPMGRTVTNAQRGQSAHNYGKAIDFVPLVFGKPVWRYPSAEYDKAIDLAEARGMESLRRNTKFKEAAHLQLPNWRTP